MPPELARDDDYASEEDSDFAPDDAPGRNSNSSASSDDEEGSGDDDDDVNNRNNNEKPGRAKRKQGSTEDAAAGFDNSGDEAVIEKGKNKKKKKKRRKLNKGEKDGDGDGDGEGEDDDAAARDEECGGAGGLIKTRSMRVAEKAERKSTAARGPVTVDVDALWAQMIGGAAATTTTTTTTTKKPAPGPAPATAQPKQDAPSSRRAADGGARDDQAQVVAAGMVRIKRIYNFAGKVHTEEKLVARDSAEAKLYLASVGGEKEKKAGEPGGEEEDGAPPKRAPRKAFRSRFEPVLDGALAPRRMDLDLGLSSARLRAEAGSAAAAAAAAAKKLNTVEKSRLDWAGFVDREGIQDELALAGRSKDSFAARQDFLARSEARREEDAWRARMAGRA